MKILFLDIDGVVNSAQFVKSEFERNGKGGVVGIDPRLAEIVKLIIFTTGCEVVLSSSWRIWDNSREQVKREVVEYIDVTPDHKGTTDRGCEVKAWLEAQAFKSNFIVDKYAILDDNGDFHKDQPLFRTSWETGITMDIAQEVIDYLNN